MILLIPLAIAAIACWWVIANATHPFPTPNAAPAPEVQPVQARARTAPPALRVHLCTECGLVDVGRPGQRCYPYCVHPAHVAEGFLRGEAS